MNPYEAPQSVDHVVNEIPPKRKLTLSQIAFVSFCIAGTQLVMHYFRELERKKKQAEMIKQIMQQVQSPLPAAP